MTSKQQTFALALYASLVVTTTDGGVQTLSRIVAIFLWVLVVVGLLVERWDRR